MLDPLTAKFFLLVLLGPVAAMYGFLTDPGAPPQIFAVQFEQGFGKPPPQIIPRPTPPLPKIRKRVYVTHTGG